MGTVSVGNASQCVAWHGFHVVYCGPQLGHRSVAYSNIGAHAYVDRLSACTCVYTYMYTCICRQVKCMHMCVYLHICICLYIRERGSRGVYLSCVHISKKSVGHQSGSCWLQEVE